MTKIEFEEYLKEEYGRLREDGKIDDSLYDLYKVKRGLRNSNGTGVLVSLTKVSDVHGYTMEGGNKIPDEGKLIYRGVDLYDLAASDYDVYGYERTVFLLLFAHLPNEEELETFKSLIQSHYRLPRGFIEDTIFKNPSKDIMNSLQRCILALYSHDEHPDSTDGYDLLDKGIALIAKLPAMLSYCYNTKRHYLNQESLHIHYTKKGLSIAELILYLIRGNKKYTPLEAETLDTLLTVHADHGGGNNSTFTNTVVSSTGTDIYSSISASLGSLKGPKHGGASRKVRDMMDAVIEEVGLNASDEAIVEVIDRILNKDFFDRSGLIYGLGHAVYTKSDPRAVLLKARCKELSSEKCEDRFAFFDRFEQLAKRRIEEVKGKDTCVNVDFYSGLTYQMLNIPKDLYIPLFACGRIAGWVAHMIETSIYCGKIIRPASKYIGEESND